MSNNEHISPGATRENNSEVYNVQITFIIEGCRQLSEIPANWTNELYVRTTSANDSELQAHSPLYNDPITVVPSSYLRPVLGAHDS